MAQTILTTNEVAAQLNVDPKTLRKFFRSDKCKIEPVGQGRRYALTPADVRGMTKAFEAWRKNKATIASTPTKTSDKPNRKVASTTPRKSTKKAAKPAPIEEDLDEDLSLDDDDEASELSMIDAEG